VRISTGAVRIARHTSATIDLPTRLAPRAARLGSAQAVVIQLNVKRACSLAPA